MNKAKRNIINHLKQNDDCKFVVFGVNSEGDPEYFKCYTYLQCNEIISDMKYSGYKNIEKIEM